MQLQNRITAFSALGNLIRSLSEEEIDSLTRKASSHNNWFTERNIRLALRRITSFLQEDKLKQWLTPYQLPEENHHPKKIGLVLPGHFPGAGFHDFLSVLITGNEIHAKLNAQDPVIIPYLARELGEIEPAFQKNIRFDEILKGKDAIIATETGNASRYLEQYLKETPHIIRKNRKAVAILDGTESTEALAELGKDITQYYGLDNRSVSKIFVPEGYSFNRLFEALEGFSYLQDHHKFVNNYDFNKSVYLINLVPHLDTGFLLFKEDKDTVSPISTVFYQTYKNKAAIEEDLKSEQDKIECVVGSFPPATTAFGKSNEPEPWEYVDGKDTIAFLKSL